MNKFYLVLFLSYTLVLSFILYRFLLKRSNRYILKKANISAERWGSQTKPIIGGIGFYVVFLFSIINYFFYFGYETIIDAKLIGILMVITLSFLMGLADDMINTSPYFKLIIQAIGAVILIYFGIFIDISPNKTVNYIITGLWVIGIMNSFNMLDNMDAITAPAALTIISGILISMFITHSHTEHFFLFIILGSFAAFICFMIYNWHPAKMYMGDNGSQFIGALLAILGIIFYWNASGDKCYCYNSRQFIAVVLAFLVPLSDTTTVTINRLLRKKSPFVGGKDHTTHHLNYLGLSPRQVALVLLGISVISVSMSIYVIYFLKTWTNVHFFLFGAFALIIFLSLYSISRISKPKNSVES